MGRYVLAALVIWGAAVSAKAVTLGFDGPLMVSVGWTASVGVGIAGLGDGAALSLGSFELEVGYDPALLRFEGLVFGDQLDFLFNGAGDSARTVVAGLPGRVVLGEFSFEDLFDLEDFQAPAFVLASLRFTGLNPGAAGLSLNPTGSGLLDSAFSSIVPAAVNGVSATVVPIPASSALALLGMAGLAWRIRR